MARRRKNLHAVLEVGKKGLAGPILYRMEHRGRNRTRVIGHYYTADEVHAKFPCFRILRSYSVERTRKGE